MNHINAYDIFSKELVEEIQKHYSGGYLFIPKRDKKERDEDIRVLFESGKSIKEIANKVNLSGMRVRQILSDAKK